MAKPENGTEKKAEAEPLSAEAKRLQARRRFLRGAGASLPLVLTFGTREARAANISNCISLFPFIDIPPDGGFDFPTLICDPADDSIFDPP